MGRESSHGSIREAAYGTVRCYLCMASPASHVVEGFGRTMVNVYRFCYNALQVNHLEGQHDTGPIR
jgi:hypothetical protein